MVNNKSKEAKKYDFYNQEEVQIMKEGGKILREILYILGDEVKEGVESIYIDSLAEKMVLERGALPIFKNYTPKGASKPYPATICISTNDEVAHGIPGKYKFKNGDVVSLDLGLKYKNFVVDSAITVSVGIISERELKLIEVTKKALQIGIDQVKDGAYANDIGKAIEKYVKAEKYKVIDTLWGHGVGRAIHTDPGIPHYDTGSRGEMLKEGMIIAIEPHITEGKSSQIYILSDGYTLKTKDKAKTAQFEHTVYVGKEEGIVLT